MSNAVGSASFRFQIPAPDTLHFSTPVLSDQVAPSTKATDHPVPAMGAHRTFENHGHLFVQFEVQGAARNKRHPEPDVEAALELLTEDGEVVRQAPSTSIKADRDGRIVRTVVIDLEGMAPGSYDLLLRGKDNVGGGHWERHERFRLEPAPVPRGLAPAVPLE